jgi:ferric-dicitrate binding protein FerR (iron transport regulator)
MDKNGNRKTILPGQKIFINNSGLSDIEEDKNQDNVIAWRTGIVYLRQATLKTAIQELKWYYPVEIQADEAILSRPLEGFFKTSHLDSALYQITMPLNLEFEKLSTGVILIKEK